MEMRRRSDKILFYLAIIVPLCQGLTFVVSNGVQVGARFETIESKLSIINYRLSEIEKKFPK